MHTAEPRVVIDARHDAGASNHPRASPHPRRPSATTPSPAPAPTACNPTLRLATRLRLDQPVTDQTPIDRRPRPATAPPPRVRADARSCADPTPDAHDATPRSAPRPPAASDADTTPAPSTHPPTPPDPCAAYRRNQRCTRLARHPEPHRDLRHRHAGEHLAAPPDNAAPRARAPPTRSRPPPADNDERHQRRRLSTANADPPV